jgi:hypothetical protein
VKINPFETSTNLLLHFCSLRIILAVSTVRQFNACAGLTINSISTHHLLSLRVSLRSVGLQFHAIFGPSPFHTHVLFIHFYFLSVTLIYRFQVSRGFLFLISPRKTLTLEACDFLSSVHPKFISHHRILHLLYLTFRIISNNLRSSGRCFTTLRKIIH